MSPELQQAIAERELRSQHLYEQRWSKADSADEAQWTIHDTLKHAHPYGVCRYCHEED